MTTTDLQAAIDHVLRLRGVETPCETCHGLGTRTYRNTGTWRCGLGGATPTKDVCDTCWGTGDAHRHGANLREWEATLEARVSERAVTLLGAKAGVHLRDMVPAVLHLAKELDAMSKTKNKVRPPWFSLVCEQVAKVLRDGVEAAKKREAK